ncbi:MAG: choice-of-anchor J domain-containing protein [Muribaculaceae bacterium]|nr:choice-of-anchor J domain-containing protein [Muribaculaceae bacterium]
MKKLAISLIALAIGTCGFSQVPMPHLKVISPSAPKKGEIASVPVKTVSGPALYASDSSLKANFSVDGLDDSLQEVYNYNFDNGLQGWTIDKTTHVAWSVENKNFSEINPADKSSLYVEGDYRVYNREKSGAVSPELTLPANAVLSMYVYYSLNFDDCCRLELSISSDGFQDENIVLWNSGNETGEKQARWHSVSADLSEYAGKKVKMRLLYTYGSGDEIFKTGGYLGDFAIDDIRISTRASIDHIDATTGEVITLVDITPGDVTSRVWNFPGATPSTSTEVNPSIYYTTDGDYDVSLTVTDKNGNSDTKTISKFISVTGTAPVAKITPPASFHLSSNRLPLVAPLANVTFFDGSDGFPSSHKWTFTGVDPDNTKLYETSEANPEVNFMFLHNQYAALEVENSHGKSSATLDFTVEYEGVINNLRTSDGTAGTNFDMGNWGVFPGSTIESVKITKYAERFSKPSRPVMVTGAYVFFDRAEAGELVDQISNVGVHLYSSKDGLPDQKIDSFWWSVYELDTKNAYGEAVGTAFPFTDCPFVDDEFFIVIDGIPSYKEATSDTGRTLVTFLMAPFRAEGNTALMYKDEKWIEAADYFPAGKNHTSFYVMPQIYHSVMAPLTNDSGNITIGKAAGKTNFEIFSYLGRTDTPEIDCGWLRVTSAPGEYTVDEIEISFDALPDVLTERTGHITFTDGASTLVLTVTQTVDGKTPEPEVTPDPDDEDPEQDVIPEPEDPEPGNDPIEDPDAGVESIVQDQFSVVRNGDILTVSGCSIDFPVEVYSLKGQKVFDGKGSSVVIDISSWNSDVYVIVNGSKAFKFVK